MSFLSLGAALLLSLAPPPEAPSPAPALSSVATEAAAAVDAFHAALARGESVAALALLAEDALILEQGGAEHGKAEYAASHLAADSAFARAVRVARTRRSGAAEGDLAWIATEAHASGRFGGRDIDHATAETMVLRRAGGAWRIVHIHWSSATR